MFPIRRFPGLTIRRTPLRIDRPIPSLPAPPRFHAVTDGFWEIVTARLPDFPRGGIIELPSTSILDQARAKMQSLGIENFNEVGDISLTQHLSVNQQGLYVPDTFQPRNPPPARSGFQPRTEIVLPLMMMAAVPFWPQTESVIIADELDLNDRTITIMRNHISHLWIIARRLKATSGAKITYSPLTNLNVGSKGPNADPNPGSPNYNPNTRQSSSNFNRAHDGGDGNPGNPGLTGPAGSTAPYLTICTLEIDGMPDILLPGQQGGRGGAGGIGASGGGGQRGRDSRVKKFAGAPVNCSSGPGWGGHGGRGGNGGQGGQGGPGGDSSHVAISTQEDQITNLVTAHPFTLNIGPGSGGDPGPQGDPGHGGQGGRAGYRTGWPCDDKPERHGHDGENGVRTGDLGRGGEGAPGQVEYAVLTPEEWILKLEAPWITSLDPEFGSAGDQVIVNGLNFDDPSLVIIEGQALNTNFNYADQITFDFPQDLGGGEHQVQVQTSDGDLSNPVPFWVRPYIAEIQMNSQPVTSIYAGDTVSLVGSSFDNGAAVEVNNRTLVANRLSQTTIEVEIPKVQGFDGGGEMRFVVQNPDGGRSNEVVARRLPSLDSGFRANPNGYSFDNFSNGNPTWGGFLETFGSEEIAGELILHPILTGAFYRFYDWFLNNNGHCSALSSTSLQFFNQGGMDLYSRYPVSNADPPPIPNDLMRRLDITQGRVLSRELVVHYADQGQVGVDRVEQTIREIESDFRDGLGESTARVLCFIPSGSVWDVFADAQTRNNFLQSHCIVPTRIVYPDESLSLNGARLYIYDNNRPNNDTLTIDLSEHNGKIHFDYTDNFNSQYSSQAGFTLASATLQRQLIDDVDLPFSGPDATAALMAFVVDLIMSPARLRLEDDAGNVLGFKDNQMHSDPTFGYVCPYLENYLLSHPGANIPRRRIIGESDGTYSYMTFHPNGRSLTILDASCSANTDDRVTIDADFDNIEFVPNEDKRLDLHLSETLSDGNVRYVNAAFDLRQGEITQFILTEGLDGINIITPNRDLDVHLNILHFDGNRLVEERPIDAQVPTGKHLKLPQGMWEDIPNFQVQIP